MARQSRAQEARRWARATGACSAAGAGEVTTERDIADQLGVRRNRDVGALGEPLELVGERVGIKRLTVTTIHHELEVMPRGTDEQP